MANLDLIEGYLAHLREESSSDRTIGDRRDILTRLDRDLPYGLDTVCADELKAWLWRDGWSLGTRETYYGAMAGFYRWAYTAQILETDPTEHISRPKPPQRLPNPITDEQLLTVLTQASEPYLTWAKLAAYAGLRCIDISRLERERVTQRAIAVIKSKGGKARVVPTHPIIWEAVRDLPAGPVTGHDPRHISVHTANYFRRTLKLPGVALHRHRHWFGTMVQRLYKDLRVTQELMGHADPRTTAGYALVAAEDTRAAIDLLPRLDAVSFAASAT